MAEAAAPADSQRASRPGRAVWLGALAGMVLGAAAALWLPGPALIKPPPIALPAPHQIPNASNGAAFHFAMVHDGLHERIVRHGPAYYLARHRAATAGIARERAQEGPGGRATDAHLALLDDQAAGLDALGRHAEAEATVRTRLALQRARGDKETALYDTYTDLAALIVHGQQDAARRGDPAARRRLEEALGHLGRARDTGLDPLFGEARWRAVALASTLAALDRPALLDRYDLLGDSLARPVAPGGKPYTEAWRQSEARQAEKMLTGDPALRYSDDQEFRRAIARVGAEDDWAKDVPGSLAEPVAFDEPLLGLLAIWRGAPPRPELALAMGEIAWRVGQKYIAWSAYERAARLGDRFWPDPAVRAMFVRRCRARQAELEPLLSGREAHAELVRKFDAELAYGQGNQRDYQALEAAQLRRGVPLDAPDFYTPFNTSHPGRATLIGQGDFAVYPDDRSLGYVLAKLPPFMALGGAAGALAALLLLRRRPKSGVLE